MERCPNISERYLIVVNAINVDTYFETTKIRVDYQHCRPISEPEIQVNIAYFELGLSRKKQEINDKALFSRLPKFILEYSELLQDTCNELLIRVAVKSFSYLTQILNAFKMFPIKKTLLLKMIPEPDVRNFESDFNLAKVYVNPNLKIFKDVDESNRLTCQPWFRFFLTKAFDCAKGRLLQYSGTCYLNSVINMVLVSPIFKLFVIQAMNEYVQKNSRVIPEIIRTLEDATACPLMSETTTTLRTIYILRAVYSILCKKIKPKRGVDLLLEAGKRYFSASTAHFYKPSLERKKTFEGGFSHFAMYTFLYDIGINFAVKDPYIGENMFFLPRKLKESEIQLLRRGNYDTFTNFDTIVSPDPTFDVLFYVVPELKLELIDGFLLECANITLKFKSGEYHAVSGIRCETGYKVIDSNDAIYDFDWRMFYLDDNREEFSRQVKQKYSDEVIDIHFAFCIYVNRANGLKIYSQNVTCNIE